MRKFLQRLLWGNGGKPDEAEQAPADAAPAREEQHPSAPDSTTAAADAQAIHTFYGAGRACAMTMLQEADYVQAHLHEVTLPAEVMARVKTLCDRLVARKHDLMSELMNLAQMAEKNAARGEMLAVAQRVVDWAVAEAREIDKVVKEVQALCDADGDAHFDGASVLLNETMGNVIGTIAALMDAHDEFEVALGAKLGAA